MRTTRFLPIAALVLAAAAPRFVAAQQARKITPAFGIALGTLSIDGPTAARSQVGDQSWGLQLDAGLVVKRHLFFGIDLGGQFLDDKAQFTQNTTGGEMNSSASITYLSALVGARTGALSFMPVELGVNAGVSATMTRRSIDNCVDCRVDKLKIPGGAFFEPTLLVGSRSFRLRVSDRIYTGGGMRSVILAGAEFTPRKR